jgi:Co/Zn/Cd efflux system component
LGRRCSLPFACGSSRQKHVSFAHDGDAHANIAIIFAGLVPLVHRSVWPDLIVGLEIAAMNAEAPREI